MVIDDIQSHDGTGVAAATESFDEHFAVLAAMAGGR